MTDNIVKTTITITALHRADTVLGDYLEDVLYEIGEGDAVGWETGRTTVPVPADQVQDELIAVGNDGTFFDDDDDDKWHEGDPYFVAVKDAPAPSDNIAKKEIWIADDGSWGDAHITFISTEGWTEEDFEEVDNASDSERLEVAQAINARRAVTP